MDDIAKYNRKRWNALVQADIEYSRPFLDLDKTTARKRLDQYGIMGEVAGKEVLCLAGSGGQQSAAFAVLGAQVTVLDLSDSQLAQDRLAANHYGVQIRAEQGDMRDLTRFSDHSFDLVYQPYSINFIPNPLSVFREVARVLRDSGLYRLDFANPFVMGMDERDWTKKGYPLGHVYRDGEVNLNDPNWQVWDRDGNMKEVVGPREFRHTLGNILNGLISTNFVILGVWDDNQGDPEAEPGSWDHFLAIAPLFLKLWARLHSGDR